METTELDSIIAEPIDIMYIAGTGRSGSTLLDRVLGQVPELFSLGELRYVWDFCFIDNNLCECGERFLDCKFWTSVTRQAFGELKRDEAAQLAREAAQLYRTANLLEIRGWFRTREKQQKLHKHRLALARLYRAIAREAGTTWLVDSSKLASYAFLLGQIPGIRLHVVHLVRDSRAVTHSWRRKRVRPEISDDTVYMPQRHSLLSAFRWNYLNLLNLSLKPKSASYVRVQYEDMSVHPRESVQRILRSAGLETASGLDFLSDASVFLRVGHTVAGNPNRFSKGSVQLKPDVAWKTEMGDLTYWLVTLATLPQLLFYGYPLTRDAEGS